MRGLKDKRIIITGAASGIGRACAQRLAAEGAELCLVDVAAESDHKLADAIDGKFTYIQADVTKPADLAKIEAWAEGGLWGLINNAGITRDSVSWKLSEDDWDKVIDVNLTAVFRLSQIAAKKLKAQNTGGVILNAASVVAHYGNFGQANYVATKAGVVGLTKTMAKELGRFGVRVNAIAPGFIRTDMTAKVPDQVLAGMEEKTPLGRLGNPDEVAALYTFLASDDAAYITGGVFNIDGGLVV
jgi:3-oxoacyl-[acyl-carrier protein] reductase